MNIFYFPEKGGPVYLAPQDKPAVFMDCTAVGTEGLIKLLEGKYGLFQRENSFNQRMCQWYSLMRPWLASHPDNILYKSFLLNELSMARQMLTWRDELKMAGWDFSVSDDLSRLGAVAAIEKEFNSPGLPDRLIRLTHKINSSSDISVSDITISLPYDKDLLPSLVGELLSVLESKGSKVVVNKRADNYSNNIGRVREFLVGKESDEAVELNPEDPSFKIIKFPTRKAEEEYLALSSGFDQALWINTDNKTFDNRLEGLRQPTTGSITVTRSRIAGLLQLLISLYCRPLNIHNVVGWLSAPYNPLPARFRFTLAEKISSSGGYMNKGCRDIINNYIEGKFNDDNNDSGEEGSNESDRKNKKEMQKRIDKIKFFLPYFYGLVSVSDLKKSLEELSKWSSQRIHSLDDNTDKESLYQQFNTLTDSIGNLLLLMLGNKETDLDAKKLYKWSQEVIPDIKLIQHVAKINSRQTILTPGDIATPVERTVWVGLEGMESFESECSFLFPGEKEEIKDHAKFTTREKESRIREVLIAMPFLMTSESLVITLAEKSGSAIITTHPLFLRLKTGIRNFENFISEVEIMDVLPEKVEKITNRKRKPEFEIRSASSLKWPYRMSPSSLDTMINHPFDFFFDKMLRIRGAGLSNLPSLETTKGHVAHEVIAELFTLSCNEGKDPGTLLSSDYDRIFANAVDNQGAILNLPENLIDSKLFKIQLYECLESLVDIISENSLIVVECEGRRARNFGIADGDEEGNDLEGFIDMILEDKNGNPVIFDFKWSSGRHQRSLLEENRSIQLAIYAKLLEDDRERHISTAYFFMPKGELVTVHPEFKGEKVIVVQSDQSGEILSKIINSYRYRKSQISEGVLEANDLSPLADLRYFVDIEEKNLLPLPGHPKDKTLKDENRFSIYKLFKGLL